MMARSLRLSIVSPTGALVDDQEIAWLQARLSDGGSIGIWPGHAPLLAQTVDGPIRYSDGTNEHTLDLQAGVLHVDSAGATLLVPRASR